MSYSTHRRGMTNPTDTTTLNPTHYCGLRTPWQEIPIKNFSNGYKSCHETNEGQNTRLWLVAVAARVRVDGLVKTFNPRNTRVTSDILFGLWAKLGACRPFTLHQSEVVTRALYPRVLIGWLLDTYYGSHPFQKCRSVGCRVYTRHPTSFCSVIGFRQRVFCIYVHTKELVRRFSDSTGIFWREASRVI